MELSVATVEPTTRKELSFSVGCSRACCASSSASDWAGAAALSWRLALASAVEGKELKGGAESGVDGVGATRELGAMCGDGDGEGIGGRAGGAIGVMNCDGIIAVTTQAVALVYSATDGTEGTEYRPVAGSHRTHFEGSLTYVAGGVSGEERGLGSRSSAAAMRFLECFLWLAVLITAEPRGGGGGGGGAVGGGGRGLSG